MSYEIEAIFEDLRLRIDVMYASGMPTRAEYDAAMKEARDRLEAVRPPSLSAAIAQRENSRDNT